MAWNAPGLTEPLTQAVFPVLAATHQVNRVAALAVSAAEMLAFGRSTWPRSSRMPRPWAAP